MGRRPGSETSVESHLCLNAKKGVFSRVSSFILNFNSYFVASLEYELDSPTHLALAWHESLLDSCMLFVLSAPLCTLGMCAPRWHIADRGVVSLHHSKESTLGQQPEAHFGEVVVSAGSLCGRETARPRGQTTIHSCGRESFMQSSLDWIHLKSGHLNVFSWFEVYLSFHFLTPKDYRFFLKRSFSHFLKPGYQKSSQRQTEVAFLKVSLRELKGLIRDAKGTARACTMSAGLPLHTGHSGSTVAYM